MEKGGKKMMYLCKHHKEIGWRGKRCRLELGQTKGDQALEISPRDCRIQRSKEKMLSPTQPPAGDNR